MPGALAFAAALAARPYDMARMASLRERLEDGRRARPAAWSSARTRRASPTIGAIALPGATERGAAGPARPRRDRGVGGQRLLVGQGQGEPCAGGDGGRADEVAAGFLRISFGPDDQRGRRRRLPRRVAAAIAERRRAGGMIYLDYQATTPLAPEVAAAMRPWIEEKFANPHSRRRRWGARRRRRSSIARDQVADRDRPRRGAASPSPAGATEALNWAIKGTLERSERRKIVTIATEHAAVLDSVRMARGARVSRSSRLPVGARRAGRPRPRREQAIDDAHRAGRGDAGQQRDRRDPAGRRAGRAGARASAR